VIIVLVDDDEMALESMSAILRRLEQDVRPHSDPRVALLDLGEDVDLVLADVTMPVLDGFRVALRVTALLGSSPPEDPVDIRHSLGRTHGVIFSEHGYRDAAQAGRPRDVQVPAPGPRGES